MLIIATAGVDPWDLQDKLDAGRPGDIDALAHAYHSAGSHVGEADAIFGRPAGTFKAPIRLRDGLSRHTDAYEDCKRMARRIWVKQLEKAPGKGLGGASESVGKDISRWIS